MKIFIDTETIAAQSERAIELLKSNIEQAKEKLSPPSNYKADTAEKWLVKKRLELDNGFEQAHLKTSLNGDLGEIITIGFKVENDITMTIFRKDGETEKELLEIFIDYISREIKTKGGTDNRITWIGHNLIKFDLPFIFKRCVINNIKPSFDIPINARHGMNAYDTSAAWCLYGKYISQDSLCRTLGLPTKQGMDGSKVYQAWLDGKHEEIADYCKSDVDTVVSLYNRLTFNQESES